MKFVLQRATGWSCPALIIAVVLILLLSILHHPAIATTVTEAGAVTEEGAASEASPPPAVLRHLPDARLVGSARLSWFFFSLYDARLYAPPGFDRKTGPFALQLTYLRDFSRNRLVDATLEELRQQADPPDQSLQQDYRRILDEIYPDIRKGDRLTAILNSQGRSLFFHNEKAIGSIDIPSFSRNFFAIWLGWQTRDPAFTRQLLGQSPAPG